MASYPSDIASRLALTQDQEGKILDNRNLDYVNYPNLKLYSSPPVDNYRYEWEPIDQDGERSYYLVNPRLGKNNRRDYGSLSYIFDTEMAVTAELSITPALEVVSLPLAEECGILSSTMNTSSSFLSLSIGSYSITRPASRNAVVRGSGSFDIENFHQEHAGKQLAPYNNTDPFDLVVGEDGIIRFVCEINQELEHTQEESAALSSSLLLQSPPSPYQSSTSAAAISHLASIIGLQEPGLEGVKALQQECATKPHLPFNPYDPFNLTIGEDGIIRFVHEEELSPVNSVFDNDGKPPSDQDPQTSPSSDGGSNGADKKKEDKSNTHDDHVSKDGVSDATGSSNQQHAPSILETVVASPPGEDAEASIEFMPITAPVLSSGIQSLYIDDDEETESDVLEDLGYGDISDLQAELLKSYSSSENIQRDLTDVLNTFLTHTTIEDSEDGQVPILQGELLRAYASSEEIQRDLTIILDTIAGHTIVEDSGEEEEVIDEEAIGDTEECDISDLQAELLRTYSSSEEIQRDLTSVLDTFVNESIIEDIEDSQFPVLQAELFRAYASSDDIQRYLTEILDTFTYDATVEDLGESEVSDDEVLEDFAYSDTSALQAELLLGCTSSDEIQRDLTSILDTFANDTTVEDLEDFTVPILQAEFLRAYTSSEEIQRDLTNILSTFAANTIVEDVSNEVSESDEDDEITEILEDNDVSALQAELLSVYTSPEEIQREISSILDTFDYPTAVDGLEDRSIIALQSELFRSYDSSDQIQTDLANILETLASHDTVEDVDEEEVVDDDAPQDLGNSDTTALQAELFRAYTSSKDIQGDLSDILDAFADTTIVEGDEEEEAGEQAAEEFETFDVFALQAELVRAYDSSEEIQGYLTNVLDTFDNNATVTDFDEEYMSDDETTEGFGSCDASILQAELLRAHITSEEILVDLCNILNYYAYHATVEDADEEEMVNDKTLPDAELGDSLVPENDVLGSFDSMEQHQKDALATQDTAVVNESFAGMIAIATDNTEEHSNPETNISEEAQDEPQTRGVFLSISPTSRPIYPMDFDEDDNLMALDASGISDLAEVPERDEETVEERQEEFLGDNCHISQADISDVSNDLRATNDAFPTYESDEDNNRTDDSLRDLSADLTDSLRGSLQSLGLAASNKSGEPSSCTLHTLDDSDVIIAHTTVASDGPDEDEVIDKNKHFEWLIDSLRATAPAHVDASSLYAPPSYRQGLLQELQERKKTSTSHDDHDIFLDPAIISVGRPQPTIEDEASVPRVESFDQTTTSDVQEDIAEPRSVDIVENDKDVSKAPSISKFMDIGFPGLKTDLQIVEFFGNGKDGAETKAQFAALLRQIRRTITELKPSPHRLRSTKSNQTPRVLFSDRTTTCEEEQEVANQHISADATGESTSSQPQFAFQFGGSASPPPSWLFGRKVQSKPETSYQQVTISNPRRQTIQRPSGSSTITSIFFGGDTSSDHSSRSSSFTDIELDGGNGFGKDQQDQEFVLISTQTSTTAAQQSSEEPPTHVTAIFDDTEISPALSTASSKFRVFSPEPIVYRGRLRRQRKWSNLRSTQTSVRFTDNPFNNISGQEIHTAVGIDNVRTTQTTKMTEPFVNNGVSEGIPEAASMLHQTPAKVRKADSLLSNRVSRIPSALTPVSKKQILQPGLVPSGHRQQSPASSDGTPNYARHTISSTAKMVGSHQHKQHPRVTSLRSNASVSESSPTVTKEREMIDSRPITPSPTSVKQKILPLQRITSPRPRILQNSPHPIQESKQVEYLPILQPTKRIIPPLPAPIQRPRPVLPRPLPAKPDLANRPRTRPSLLVKPIPDKISYVIPWQVPLYAPVAQQPGYHHARIVAEMAPLDEHSIHCRSDFAYGSKTVANFEEIVREY